MLECGHGLALIFPESTEDCQRASGIGNSCTPREKGGSRELEFEASEIVIDKLRKH